jgi:hypothetical protein
MSIAYTIMKICGWLSVCPNAVFLHLQFLKVY